MTGKQLIDAIKKHHLEELEVYDASLDACLPTGWIEFNNGSEKLPYPEFKDSLFDEPAFIYRYKVLLVDMRTGESECEDRVNNTSEAVVLEEI